MGDEVFMQELAQVLALTRLPSCGLSQAERVLLLLEHGSTQALELACDDLLGVSDILARCQSDVDAWALSYSMTHILHPTYPHYLASIRESPALVFYQGNLLPADQAIAVVGSRAATDYECGTAAEIARLITSMGLTVASGLAHGIDRAAHEATLAAGGRTVAVMGTGLERTYPSVHVRLREDIIASSGLVLTQFEPYSPVHKYNFPMRNITMSGYSMATVIVAAHNHSGTRHQAERALAHGRYVFILDTVLDTASWAQQLTQRAGVHVVHSLDHLHTLLEHTRRAHNTAA